LRENKGKKVDDPFTRRSTKPRMVFKAEDKNPKPDEDENVRDEISFKFGLINKMLAC
jgi:hypothetical protein